MSTKPECPYCGERERLRIACEGTPGWCDPDYICPACWTGQDDGPCFDDLPPVKPDEPDTRFEALKAYGWSPAEARKILREAARGDAYAKADISRAKAAAREPANVNVDPMAAAISFVMLGRVP